MPSRADLTVIFEQDKEGNIIATAPDIPNCRVVGKSMEEAQEKIKEAILKEIGCEPGSSIRLESAAPIIDHGHTHGPDCGCGHKHKSDPSDAKGESACGGHDSDCGCKD
jgi:ABC-type nickel/cobalt efflux system permease component RcnA